MIKHVVMWKLKEFDDPAARQEAIDGIKSGLEGLVGVVPGLVYAQVGENFTDGGYDLCLYAELESREALAVYQEHPAHLKVKKLVAAARVDRVCSDWEV